MNIKYLLLLTVLSSMSVSCLSTSQKRFKKVYVEEFKLVIVGILTLWACACTSSQKGIGAPKKDYIRAFKIAVFHGCLNEGTKGDFDRFLRDAGDLGLAREVAILHHTETTKAFEVGEAYSYKILPYEYEDYEGRRPLTSHCAQYAFYSREVNSMAKKMYRRQLRGKWEFIDEDQAQNPKTN
ncbi:MAG: hypothetical protein KF870_12560 [Leadbetterella sp.]|nr:hypothetical protein [Leadbetterella sp.]